MSAEDPRQTAYTVGLKPAVTLYESLDVIATNLLDSQEEVSISDRLTLRNDKWRRPTEITYNGWTHPVGTPNSILNAEKPYDVLESLRGIEEPLKNEWHRVMDTQFPETELVDYIDTAQANLDNIGQTANTGDVYYDVTNGREIGSLRAYVKHPSLNDESTVVSRLVQSGVSSVAFVDEQQLVARTNKTVRESDNVFSGFVIRRSPIPSRGFEIHPVNVKDIVPRNNQYSGLLIRENGYLPDNTLFDPAGNQTESTTGHVIDELVIQRCETKPVPDGAAQRPTTNTETQTISIGAVTVHVEGQPSSFDVQDDGSVIMTLAESRDVRFECNGIITANLNAGMYTFDVLPYART